VPASEDYYKVLGVDRSATEDEIRKSYRRLARKYHPDLNPGDKSAEERFKKVQEAYDILSDGKKRQMFDQYGFYADNGRPQPGTGTGGPGFGFEGFDFEEMFRRSRGGPGARPEADGRSRQSGSFQDLFGEFFRNRRQPQGPEQGADLEYALEIDFWQSIRGAQVKLNINRQEACLECRGTGQGAGAAAACPECSGSGNVEQMVGAMRFTIACPRCEGRGKMSNVCFACRGEGRTSRPEVVEVRIPAGVAAGSRLRVAGKGNAGSAGGGSGDLYITIRVAPHPFFERDGDNILVKVPVTVAEAGLGTKIEVPTIDGRALLKIPQGTQNGQKFRLREKGVLNARRNAHGDQIVVVEIVQPDIGDERTRELLRELAKQQSADPRAEMWAKV
jgi:molecular chaperone DnaJ